MACNSKVISAQIERDGSTELHPTHRVHRLRDLAVGALLIRRIGAHRPGCAHAERNPTQADQAMGPWERLPSTLTDTERLVSKRAPPPLR